MQVYESLVSKRLEAGEDPFPITFCKRVPSKVYENEKVTELEKAMLDLLEQVWSLTQFFSLNFSLSRNGVKKSVFNKWEFVSVVFDGVLGH